MATDLTGIVWIEGPHGSGKTTTAYLLSDNPKGIAHIDCDNTKSEALAKQVGIRTYINMARIGKGLGDLAYHIAFINEVEKLDDDYELIIVDVPKRMMIGAHAYVTSNKRLFRKAYAPMGSIKTAQQWQDVKFAHLVDVYTSLRSKAPLVVFCTGEKKQIVDGIFTGKLEPDADSSLMGAAGFVVRLVKDKREARRAPVALVIKHPDGKLNMGTGKVENVFPDRIAPFTREKIKEYIAEPFESRDPTPDEQPDPDEINLINATLSEEEQANYDLRRAQEQRRINEDMIQEIVELDEGFDEGVPPLIRANKIVAALRVHFPQISLGEVQKILKQQED